MNTPNIYSIEKIIHHSLDIEQSMYLLMELMAEKEHLLPDYNFRDNSLEIVWRKRDWIYDLSIFFRAMFENEGVINITAEVIPDKKKDLSAQEKMKDIEITLTSVKEILNGLENDFHQLSKNFTHKVKNHFPDTIAISQLESVKKELGRRYFGRLLDQNIEITFNRFALALIIVYCSVIFMLSINAEGSFRHFSSETAIRYGASLNTLIKQGEYFRLFTAPFFHFDFLHFISNIFFFTILFYILSARYGSLFLLLFLLCTALIPFSSEYALRTDQVFVSGGISGIVFACLGLYIISATSSYSFGWRGWLIALAGLTLSLLLSSMPSGRSTDNEMISHVGHFTGFFTGALFGTLSHRIFRRNYFNQHLLAGGVMATLICLTVGSFCIQKGHKGDIHVAVKFMDDALSVQDSLIQKIISYNDSPPSARIEINLRSAALLEKSITKLDSIYRLNVSDAFYQRAHLIQKYLSSEKQYYLTFAAYFSGDSTITDEVFSRVKAARDSAWAGLEW